MNVIVCVDDRGGMLFCRRRQSQDSVLREKIIRLSSGRRLCMNAYSAKQFSQQAPENLTVDPAFLEHAGEEDYCFVEDQKLLPYLDQINRLILCRWNRSYPGDFFLDLPLEAFQKAYAEDFSGSSHEKITLEVYTK